MSQPAARVVLTCVRLFFVCPGTRNFPSEKKWVETIKGESGVKTVERSLKKINAVWGNYFSRLLAKIQSDIDVSIEHWTNSEVYQKDLAMHIWRQVSVAKELRVVVTHIWEKKKVGIISVVFWGDKGVVVGAFPYKCDERSS